MIKLGSHVSFKKPTYLVGAIEESLDNNANCAMIYLGPPQSTFRVKPENYLYNEYLNKYNNKILNEDIIVHAPYIVNLSNPDKKEFSVNFLIEEIKRMNYINAKYLILHPGAYTKYTKDEAISTLILNIKEILKQTKDVIICLETMAGKGTEIFTNLDDIKYILNEINNNRVALCLDTCHIWDAGYNIKNYEEFKKIIKDYDLLKYIKVIHLNDSKNEMGTHKDRHANIGKGFIGLESLKLFVYDKDFDNIPIILETPYIENKSPYKEEIALLLDNKL
ncbi:deoxyribonuclease IV [Metamycoplasma buccale]|uniref:deoxyribonuclease IV n=1 Tax=Metamycoplasma buccale TaxID=55602 RepID=UPI00398F5082